MKIRLNVIGERDNTVSIITKHRGVVESCEDAVPGIFTYVLTFPVREDAQAFLDEIYEGRGEVLDTYVLS
jgi:hypothetical protein